MIIRGKVWRFAENINTDMIAPAAYTLVALEDQARVQADHCLEGADPNFTKKAKPGDIIVAGKNFGCGSARGRAATCIRDFGVAAIVAPYFSRTYTRNAIDIGLPILECAEAPERIQEGDEIEIDLSTGTIRDLTNGQVCQATPFPPFLQSLIDKGGLINYVRAKLGKDLPKDGTNPR
jgi:3-isopropylmalate/(R)-2-methylmalate dehydratase small subunit